MFDLCLTQIKRKSPQIIGGFGFTGDRGRIDCDYSNILKAFRFENLPNKKTLKQAWRFFHLFDLFVIAEGFEPSTVCLEGRCSIQLSYATWCCVTKLPVRPSGALAKATLWYNSRLGISRRKLRIFIGIITISGGKYR